jgi:hypothetical protein
MLPKRKHPVICPPEVDTLMNLDKAKTLPAEGRAVKVLSGFLTPIFAFKKRKNLIRSNPSSRSLC